MMKNELFSFLRSVKNSHSLLHGLLARRLWLSCWWVPEARRCPVSLVPAAWLLVYHLGVAPEIQERLLS